MAVPMESTGLAPIIGPGIDLAREFSRSVPERTRLLMIDLLNGKKAVALGEAAHGTSECGSIRAEISMVLLRVEHSFRFVAGKAIGPTSVRRIRTSAPVRSGPQSRPFSPGIGGPRDSPGNAAAGTITLSTKGGVWHGPLHQRSNAQRTVLNPNPLESASKALLE